MAGRFVEALNAQRAHEVGMDKAEFVPFEKNGICSVGTRNLNSCSVAALVSPLGAIFAHIPPRPTTYATDPQDPFAGDRHVEEMMSEVASLYTQNENYFPPEKSALVVSALYQGNVALPDQRAIMNKSFERMGTIPISGFYSVLKPSDPRRPAQGTVFVDAGGEKPIVYVEDQEIHL
jgi:hypothetical protein